MGKNPLIGVVCLLTTGDLISVRPRDGLTRGRLPRPLLVSGLQLLQKRTNLRSINVDRLRHGRMPIPRGFFDYQILRLLSQLLHGALNVPKLDRHHFVPSHIQHQHAGFDAVQLTSDIIALADPQLINPVVGVQILPHPFC